MMQSKISGRIKDGSPMVDWEKIIYSVNYGLQTCGRR